MIDTDKYEGHTKGEKSEYHPSGWWVKWVAPCNWYIHDPEVHLVGSEANRLLIQDAPLLFEEVKRLREAIADIATNMHAADASYMCGFIDDLWKVIE